MKKKYVIYTFTTITFVLLTIGCKKHEDVTPVDDYSTYKIKYFDVSGGSYIQSKLPSSSSNPPVISNVVGNSYVLNGGNNMISFESSTEVSYVVIGLKDVGGYYKIPVSELSYDVDGNYQLILTISQTIVLESINFYIAYIDISKKVSNYYLLNASQMKAGTGFVQINCTWSEFQKADVDLHVIDPDNEEIYWNNKNSAMGGYMDFDAQAACNNTEYCYENVFYKSYIKKGQYIIRVNLWSACDVTEPINVVCSSWMNGQIIPNANGSGNNYFSKTFYPYEANKGGKGYGTTVFYMNVYSDQYASIAPYKNSINELKNCAFNISDKLIIPKKSYEFHYDKINKQKNRSLSTQKAEMSINL